MAPGVGEIRTPEGKEDDDMDWRPTKNLVRAATGDTSPPLGGLALSTSSWVGDSVLAIQWQVSVAFHVMLFLGRR